MKQFFKDKISHQLMIAGLCVMTVGMFSCKREMLQPELLTNYEGNNYREIFTVFWQGMNSHYLFWDQEKINWDSMYRVYKPKFDSLDIKPYSDTTNNQCFQYMTDMTKDFKDGQYALMLWGGGDYQFDGKLYKSYISFIPKLMRTQEVRPALPDTLFDYIIQYNYLKNFDYGLYTNYNTGSIFQIITGRISKGTKNIIYTSLNNFNLKEAYNATYGSRPCRPVITNLFNNIHKSNCDAIIIDLRNNRGGNLEDVDFFAGQFTQTAYTYGYARYKNGSGRLDYTPQIPMQVTPQTGATEFTKPIVILTDMYSAALCESVVLAFKGLAAKNVTVIGEKTYGTAGFLTGDEVSNLGGSFNITSMGAVRLSNAAMFDKNHKLNLDGMQPDLEVKYDQSKIDQMRTSGVDIQMEKAIQFINH